MKTGKIRKNYSAQRQDIKLFLYNGSASMHANKNGYELT